MDGMDGMDGMEGMHGKRLLTEKTIIKPVPKDHNL
jgi:hypothetical protein